MTSAAENVVPVVDAAQPEKAEKIVDKRRALGRGLESLLPAGPRAVPGMAATQPAAAQASAESPAMSSNAPQSGVIAEIHAQAARVAAGDVITQLPLDQIDANPYQTRMEFDQDMLEELGESIRANGVVQPIVVRPAAAGRYVLVLGERRCRASKMVGKQTIPAIVRKVSDQQAAEMTIVENLQRADLNCMEQASAFKKLSKEFNLTQEQIGDRVGLSRESVSNYMRLLRLPGTVMQYLMHGTLGFSEARELLKLEENEAIAKLANEIVEKQLSFLHVQDRVEAILLKRHYDPTPPAQVHGARWVDPNVRAAQVELQRILGVKVKISDRNGKGKILIEYHSVDDYERVVGMLRGKN